MFYPVIRTHPETGRKSLYFDPGKICYLVGVEEKESDALFAELKERMITPDAEYHHVWRKGDIVIWDNRFVPQGGPRLPARGRPSIGGCRSTISASRPSKPRSNCHEYRSRPFEAGLGAEIRGVDIREPLSLQERDAVRAAWLEHLVLRFRDQPMDDAQHMAFTRQFGDLEFNPAALIAKQYGVETQTAGRRQEIPPEISVISNIIEDGEAIGGLGDGEAFWHTDSSFVDVPPAASLLRSLEAPPPSAVARPISSTCIRPMRHCRRRQNPGSTAGR